MRSYLTAVIAACTLPACSNIWDNHTNEHSLPFKIGEKVHALLLQDPDSRSLYRVMQETESLFKKTLPESSIVVDVQLDQHKTSRGIWYLRLQCTIDKDTYTFFLTAQQIQQDGEKIMPKEIVKKLIWDMRETCRNYLQDRMSLYPSRHNGNPEKWLQTFLEEEKDVLAKHGLIFNGTIDLTGNILSISFVDMLHWWDVFVFTFMADNNIN